jgi:hypothetical protein
MSASGRAPAFERFGIAVIASGTNGHKRSSDSEVMMDAGLASA